MFVDILRGFALLGVFIANMQSFAGHAFGIGGYDSVLDQAVRVGIQFFIQAKFYTLFSFLFGWGVALQWRRAQAKGVRFVPLHLRRMLVLAVIGVIHGALIWDGDILLLYAIMGTLLVLFRNWPPRRLLVLVMVLLGLALVLALPGDAIGRINAAYADLTRVLRTDAFTDAIYANGDWLQITERRARSFISGESWLLYRMGPIFSMFVLGLYVGKRKLFTDMDAHLPLFRRTLVLGLLVGVLFNGLYTLAFIWDSTGGWPNWIPSSWHQTVYTGSRTIGAPALMLFYTTSLALFTRTRRGFERLQPLSHIGRTALTNYLLQSIICTLIFYNYGLGLYGEMGPFFGLLLTLIIFLLQIRLSAWWLDNFRFGPFEWVWRTLSYGAVQPLRYGPRAPRRAADRHQTRKRIAVAVAFTAAIVALGAAGWFLWQTSQNAEPSAAEAARVAPTATPIVPRATAPDTGQDAPIAVATPRVEPVSRNPDAAAAAADVAVLAGRFDAARARDEIAWLTGPPFFGRYPGSSEERAAADAIAARFADLGLQPAGEDGTYFQTVPIDILHLADPPTLTISSPEQDRAVAQQAFVDFAPLVGGYAGAGTATGPVVWANRCAVDDFAKLPVVGAIIFCRPDDPFAAARQAVEHGAAGLLVLDPERAPDVADVYRPVWIPEPLPTLRISAETAADLLQGTDATIADLSIDFRTFPLDTRATLNVATTGAAACATQPCTSRNVLGVLPGRNPAAAGEVILLGAQLDHFGQAPGGVQWVGANAGASGVATLLEIARVWQEAGLTPQRTVLFAAWGASERDQAGSTWFAARPSYPLTSTVGALTLDGVGAGADTLIVAGDGRLATALSALASTAGITPTRDTVLTTDQQPLVDAGVDGATITYLADASSDVNLHRPSDTPTVIDVEKLDTAGEIAMLATLQLAELEPALDAMLAQRVDAVLNADRSAFLATSAESRTAVDAAWFEDAIRLDPVAASFSADNVTLSGTTAHADVTLALTHTRTASSGDPVTRTVSATGPVTFANDGSGWRWNGVALTPPVQPPTSTFAVSLPAQHASRVAAVAAAATTTDSAVRAQLGLGNAAPATLTAYDTLDALRLDTGLSLTLDDDGATDANNIRLLYSAELTSTERLNAALVHLALAQNGVDRDTLPWLWDGLPHFLAVEAGREAAPLQALQAALDAETPVPPRNDATNWAAIAHLVDAIGRDELGAFIVAVGQRGADAALRQATGADATAFGTAWQDAWQTRLATAQRRLDAVLDARAAAIEGQDRAAFLRTVDADVPGLRAEQTRWFDAATATGDQAGEFSAEWTTVLPDGSLVATVTFTSAAGASASPIRFVVDGDRLLWAGAPFDVTAGDQIIVWHSAESADLAAEVATLAAAAYPTLAADLGMSQPPTATIKLYDTPDAFHASIVPTGALPAWVTRWAMPDEAVKLLITEDTDTAAIRADLFTALGRHLLQTQGIGNDGADEWLLNGLASRAAVRSNAYGLARQLDATLRHVLRDITKERLTPFDAIPPDHLLGSADDQARLASQVYDFVRTLEAQHGADALRALVEARASGATLDAAFRSATGAGYDDAVAAWADSLLVAHAQPEALAVAARFDGDRALADVAVLTDPALGGRRTGSDGAAIAAAYIAETFAAAGLEPVAPGQFFASPVTPTVSAEPTYTHPFTIEYAALPLAPALNIARAGTDRDPLGPFFYRDAFLDALNDAPYGGRAEGPLVWVNDGTYRDMDLSGKIAVRFPQESIAVEVERAAAAGAAGLLLAGDEGYEKAILSKQPLPVTYSAESSLPVLILTEKGVDIVLDALDETRVGLRNGPPAQDLGLTASLHIPLGDITVADAVNVLGLLPGSDPTRRDEVILLSAHYDHVGDDPDALFCDGIAIADAAQVDTGACERVPGLTYPGANDNASGVAVLLEIARLWQTTGYRPQQSVLFAALDAQEPGELGAAAYLADPVFPLDATVAVPLDTVGGGRGFRLLGHGEWDNVGALLLSTEIAETMLEGRTDITSSQYAQGDAVAFSATGVPTLFFSWTDTDESNLPADSADLVNPDHLATSGRMLTFILMNVLR